MPRTQIEPHKGDKRDVRRKGGKFTKSQDDASVARWSLTGANVRSELSRAVKVIEATGCASTIYLVNSLRWHDAEPLQSRNLQENLCLATV